MLFAIFASSVSRADSQEMHRSFAWRLSAAQAHAGLRMTNQSLRRRTGLP
jgi:hypothetical protein